MSYAEHSFPTASNMTSAIGLRAAEIRRRLMNPPNAYDPEAARILSLPAPLVEAEPAPEPVADVDGTPWGAPLNMLKPCSWRFLVALAAARHGVAPEVILSADRITTTVAARSEAMHLVWCHTQKSLPQVGWHFGRDHSTVLHCLRKFPSHEKLVERQASRIVEERKKGPHIAAAGRAAASARRAIETQIAHDWIRSGYAAGKHPNRIAKELGYKPKSVRDIARRIGAVFGVSP